MVVHKFLKVESYCNSKPDRATLSVSKYNFATFFAETDIPLVHTSVNIL